MQEEHAPSKFQPNHICSMKKPLSSMLPPPFFYRRVVPDAGPNAIISRSPTLAPSFVALL